MVKHQLSCHGHWLSLLGKWVATWYEFQNWSQKNLWNFFVNVGRRGGEAEKQFLSCFAGGYECKNSDCFIWHFFSLYDKYIDGSRAVYHKSPNCSFSQISKWDSLTKLCRFICKTYIFSPCPSIDGVNHLTKVYTLLSKT